MTSLLLSFNTGFRGLYEDISYVEISFFDNNLLSMIKDISNDITIFLMFLVWKQILNCLKKVKVRVIIKPTYKSVNKLLFLNLKFGSLKGT